MKKFFSAILLMTAMVFSVSTFVSCNDLTSELEDVRTQTTEMESTIKTLSDKVTALESALTTAQNAADEAKAAAAAAKAAGDAALAQAEAAEAAAATAKAEAIAEATAQVKALKEAFEAKVQEMGDAIAAHIKDVEAALAVINTKIAAIETSLADKADKTYVDAELAKLLAADATINAEIKALKAYEGLIEELQLADENIKADIAAQAATLETLKNEVEENTKQINTCLATIASVSTLVSDLDEAVFGETGFYNEVFGDGPNSIKSQLGSIANLVADLQAGLDDLNMRLVALGERLTSLVFIPELYVGGIEATEYTYMPYNTLVWGGTTAKTGNDDQGNNFVLSENKNWDYKSSTTTTYENPVHNVSYFINPSHADLSNATLRFVSNDVETRASLAAPAVKTWTVDEVDGRNNLVVSMTALGQKIETDEASIFALEATVTEDGKDTVVTSDFARLAPRTLNLVDLYNVIAEDHIYKTAPEALQNKPTLVVKYDGNIDIRDVVETHYEYDLTTCATQNVYEDDYMPENVYGLQWKFALVDYTIGGNATSDSQFATLDGSVLTPCGTTDGKANGKTQASSIGKRPLVRVTVQDRTGKDILAGFIKLEIVREASYVVADPTSWTTPFSCAGADVRQTWSQFVDNILTATTDLSKEEFEAMYKLEKDADGNAVQYEKNNGNFVAVATADTLGKVTEVPDLEATTTNVLRWTMSMAKQQYVYAEDGATIYVRYIFESTADNNATQYEGIFVPLTMKVTKPTTSVSKKIAEYWFNNEANAIINVARPTDGGSTLPWETDINQVWNGNAPKFAAIDASYTSYQKINQTGHYKYYFAPEQPKVAGYQLYVKATSADDMTTGDPVEVTKNADLFDAELENALDVTTGFYTNTVLYAKEGANEYEIATLDQGTGVVTYNQNDLSKKLLNAFASVARSEAKLYANIAVANWNDCKVAVAIKEAVNPYYFLRPINYVANGKGQFVDGEANGSKVNILDLFDFSDWRDVDFLTEDYKNIWLFAYYNIHSVVVDIENVMTDLNQEDNSFVKLSTVTNKIIITHERTRTTIPMLNYNTTENSVAGSTQANYEAYRDLFGKICYKNNGSVVSGFQIKVPVKFIYDWGEIETYAVIPVVETMGN